MATWGVAHTRQSKGKGNRTSAPALVGAAQRLADDLAGAALEQHPHLLRLPGQLVPSQEHLRELARRPPSHRRSYSDTQLVRFLYAFVPSTERSGDLAAQSVLHHLTKLVSKP